MHWRISRNSIALRLCLASCVLQLPHCFPFRLSNPGLHRRALASMSVSSLPSRDDAKKIFQAAVAAVNPELLAESAITVKEGGKSVCVAGREVSAANGVHLIAFGKASLRMARGAEKKLGEVLRGGVVICQSSDEAKQEGFKSEIVTGAAGNMPDEGSLSGTTKAVELATKAGEGETIIVLVSGGGSALLTLPVAGISLADKLAATKALVRAGASIQQLNTVRKHLSLVKGGQLAAAAYPATVVGLVLSDVVGDPLDVIASGPTVCDTSSYQDALAVIDSLSALSSLPPSVVDHLKRGAAGNAGVSETPKEGDERLQSASTNIVGSNRIAANAAIFEAQALGYAADVATLELNGDTSDAALMVAATVRQLLAAAEGGEGGGEEGKEAEGGKRKREGGDRCVLLGGETTVMLPSDAAAGSKGPGKGGRASHLALLVAKELEGVEGWTLLCGATDGQDGPTDAAGAFVDGGTMRRAREKGCDAHEAVTRCDSYGFFAEEGGLYKIGLTGTNVMDMHVLLVSSKPETL